MQITIFGVAVFLLGVILLVRGSVMAMLLFVLVCSLMGGSAAIILTSLGNSSVPPTNLAVIFLAVRCLLPNKSATNRLWDAVRANRWLVVFVLYGSITAWILPNIFAGMLDVTPLRPNPGKYLLAASPLQFSSQNITVSLYLMSTLIAGVCAYQAISARSSFVPFVRAISLIAVTHGMLGFASVLFAGPLAPFFSFFRNGFYAQLNQSISGFVRMSGIWAEPAIFAAYGFIWLVLTTELWIRNVEPRWTGPALLVLLSALIASTSSTAYVGLGGYTIILLLRAVFQPGAIPARKLLVMAFGAVVIVGSLMLAAVLQPALLDALGRVIALTTIDKLDSESGIQRAFWARQGYEAFIQSYGLGIGAGSFRSSSLLTAILGSVGMLGSFAFIAHLVRVFQPLRRSTYAVETDAEMATGAAASWTAVVMLIPATFSAASPDPGLLWAVLSGAALALRPARTAASNFRGHDNVTQNEQRRTGLQI